LAERFAKIQRKGKLEKEVLDRWKSIFEKWWNELTFYADENHVCSNNFNDNCASTQLTLPFFSRTLLWNLMNGLNSLRLWGRTQKAIKNCLNS
jgi:hypothetical protein